jgi:hypothetical protein
MDPTPPTSSTTPPNEKWSATVRYRYDRRQLEVDVPACSSAIDAIKRKASRLFDWPISDIVLEHGRHVIMANQLAHQKLPLGQVNLRSRQWLLNRAREGKFDPARDALRIKAKQQQQQQGGSDAKGDGDAVKQTKSAEQPTAPAAVVDPMAAEKEVESYVTFLELARAAAGDAIDDAQFQRGISQALIRIARAGKGETTSKPWRAQQLAAIRAGAFDFERGTINQVAAALDA